MTFGVLNSKSVSASGTPAYVIGSDPAIHESVWLVPTNASISSESDTIYFATSGNDLEQLTVQGSIIGLGGINFYGQNIANESLLIAQTGVISGQLYAVGFMGPALVVNQGMINGAVLSNGGDLNVRNSGLIDGTIQSSGDTVTVYNRGTIDGLGASAVHLTAGQLVLHNTGTIVGDIMAQVGSDGLIVNHGVIEGAISQGDNNDTIDNHDGTITGTIDMGDGDDLYIAGSHDGTVYGGDGGNDTISFAWSDGVTFALDGSLDPVGWADVGSYAGFENVIGARHAANTLGGDDNDNVLTGGGLADTLSGGNGNDTLYGRGGADTLYGGGGSDTLYGGSGADKLYGGPGGDTLYGGAGADKFIFADGDLSTTGTITAIMDFSHGDKDKIDLSAIDANTTVAGDQAFTWLGKAAFTGHAGELHATVTADPNGSGNTVLLITGDTNGDKVADIELAVFNVTSLVAGDFIL